MKTSGYFNSDQEQLYYVADYPEALRKPRTGIIFVHAAHGNRFGPHRMFVEYADRLSQNGYLSIRFDLAGCGDSSGHVADGDDAIHSQNILSAISFFRDKYRLERLYLFGISRGAHLIFSNLTESELPVSGAILLSCPVSSNTVAIYSVATRAKGYLHKCFDVHSLRKLLTGKANVKFILKSLYNAFALRKRYQKITVHNAKSFTKCPMLFVYGQNDPIFIHSRKYFSECCQRIAIPNQEHVVQHANHSFFHYIWKEEIHTVVTEWLKKQ